MAQQAAQAPQALQQPGARREQGGRPPALHRIPDRLRALYDDRLSVEFEGNEEGDTDTAENLTDLAEHDYRVMQKDEADYESIWDACFFGRGLLLLNEFDRSKGVMAPVTEVIDPLMWSATRAPPRSTATSAGAAPCASAT